MKPTSRAHNQPPDLTVLVNNLSIDIQRASSSSAQPDDETIHFWVNRVLQLELESLERQTDLCIRIVDETEIATLNLQYRQQSKPTNVLSFPVEKIPELPEYRLGDLVICAPVVNQEALQQKKSSEAHWAHMIIHGLLHLCGYDHINDLDAQKMEEREVSILTNLKYSNPYEVK